MRKTVPMTPGERAPDAAGLLGECRWSYDDDAAIAAIIAAAVRELVQLAESRSHQPAATPTQLETTHA